MKAQTTLFRRIGNLVLITVAAAIILILAGRGLLELWRPVRMIGDSWVFQENRNGPVIGNLSGVPVSIPQPFARFVEYDGDPNFMEKRLLPAPERTYQSGLRSFGFEVRYPDMASSEAKIKENSNIYTTMWMRVGISAGEDYGSTGDDSLERHAAYITKLGAWSFPYELLPEKTFGLIGYTPVGVDLSRRDLSKGAADSRDKNRYYFRNQDGRVTTYIECGNMLHSADRCQQFFNLSADMKAHVWVNYRKALLPHWRQIQASVSKVILGFQVETELPEQTK